MNYRITYHASASSKIPGLPPEAFTALVERLLEIGDDPLDSSPIRSEEPNFRHATFGEHGIVAFFLDRPARTVTVYDILWAG
ncbi:hypothetical protein FHR32_008209 [Streptosporangium album]|uniref:Type II toxin-antitoxin system RelE/ParE family toxin n=1 Tax=Streptosporangium album TaxID=47479 RepID=A0A7W7S5U2_9ACTN|nr:hypothetical protein [Streptosporangium album]MBB4943808.1 hypothetical protein [Streptosporangium album]